MLLSQTWRTTPPCLALGHPLPVGWEDGWGWERSGSPRAAAGPGAPTPPTPHSESGAWPPACVAGPAAVLLDEGPRGAERTVPAPLSTGAQWAAAGQARSGRWAAIRILPAMPGHRQDQDLWGLQTGKGQVPGTPCILGPRLGWLWGTRVVAAGLGPRTLARAQQVP